MEVVLAIDTDIKAGVLLSTVPMPHRRLAVDGVEVLRLPGARQRVVDQDALSISHLLAVLKAT
jgi:hypothetical protein